MKDFIWTMVVLVVVALLMTAGCETSNSPNETDSEQDDLIYELKGRLDELYAVLENHYSLIDAAMDVNGINLNLLKRVSALETEQAISGDKPYDNSARLDDLEAGRDPDLSKLWIELEDKVEFYEERYEAVCRAMESNLEVIRCFKRDLDAATAPPGPNDVYDPNNPIYKFIPEAGDDWKKAFGDTDDTRMKHTISEMRVIMAGIGRRLLVLENLADPNEVVDPNGVK